MSFCCDALKASFKSGFCRIRALKGDESECGVRFGIVMGLGNTEMIHCPFCGKMIEVVLREVKE